MSDYVSGGYYVLKAIPRPIDLPSSVLPDTLLTMSTCFTRVAAHVIGIGLHTSLLASFESQLDKDMNRGTGLLELVNEKRVPADGGHVPGFEPLGFEATTFHSWLCHYAPDEAHTRFGIRPNHLGLIDGLNAARQVNEYLLETGAEQAIWEPWLILDYASTGT